MTAWQRQSEALIMFFMHYIYTDTKKVYGFMAVTGDG